MLKGFAAGHANGKIAAARAQRSKNIRLDLEAKFNKPFQDVYQEDHVKQKMSGKDICIKYNVPRNTFTNLCKFYKLSVLTGLQLKDKDRLQYVKDNVLKIYQEDHITKQMTTAEIANKHNIDKITLARWFRKHNLDVKKYQRINRSETQQLLYDNLQDIYQKEHLENKLTAQEISVKYGFEQSSFGLICEKSNLPLYRWAMSKEHRELSNWLKTILVNVENNNRRIIKPNELDIWLPDYNLAIEINGVYWHSDLHKSRYDHLNKLKICQEKRITLLQFWDLEVKNKLPIVKSIIKNRLGLNSISIGARKCQIKVINSAMAKKFQQENHILGQRNSSVNLGMFYKNQLISVMSFIKHSKYQWELIRFSNLSGFNVVGSASKFLNYFIEKYNPNSIVSYADRRLFEGNIYLKLGFSFSHYSPPGYFYYNPRDTILKLKTRSEFRKSKLLVKLQEFKPELTEKENMKNHGYLRVYDCGHSCFVWNKPK